MIRYVALYLRISKTSPDSIDDQEMQGREYAARVWPGVPVVVFAEDGVSGEKEDVDRPRYDELRAAVGRMEVAQIWAAEQSRLERNPVRWFRLAQELVDGGIDELHFRREGIVRVDSELADFRAVMNWREVKKLRGRVHDKLATNAARGNAPASLPFGYARDGKSYKIIPEQAAEVQLAADRVLAGWSLTDIAKDMAARGFRGARGGELRPETVKSMLTNPSIAAFRVYQGEIVGKGNWQWILDEPTWRLMCAKLSQPRTVNRKDGGVYNLGPSAFTGNTGRKYLLTSGLAVCGLCGTPLVGAPHHRWVPKGKPKPAPKARLTCHPNKGGCSRVGVQMEPADAHVLERLWAELDKPEFLQHVASDDHAARRDELDSQLAGLEVKRGELAALWATPGELRVTEWQAARAALDQQEAELKRELAELPAPTRALPDIALVRAEWPDMNLGEQREFIRSFIERVTVQPVNVRGSKLFDHRRIKIKWRYDWR